MYTEIISATDTWYVITYQWTHIERIISDNSAGDFNIYPCFAILPHFSDKLTFILWRHLVATFVAPSCLADKNRSKSEQNFLIKIVFNVRSPTELTVNFDKRLSADMSVMRYLQFKIYFSVIPKKFTFFWLKVAYETEATRIFQSLISHRAHEKLNLNFCRLKPPIKYAWFAFAIEKLLMTRINFKNKNLEENRTWPDRLDVIFGFSNETFGKQGKFRGFEKQNAVFQFFSAKVL